jgi:hypothetical protein
MSDESPRGLRMSTPLAIVMFVLCGFGFACLGWMGQTAYDHYCAVVNMNYQMEMMRTMYRTKPQSSSVVIDMTPQENSAPNPEPMSFDSQDDPDCGPRG